MPTLHVVGVDVNINVTGTTRSTSPGARFGNISGNSYAAGIRFRQVPLPKGCVITNAYISLAASAQSTVTVNAKIAFEDADNPTLWTTGTDFNGRTRTAYVNWNSVPASTSRYQTPDLSTILQSVVNRAGWATNNAINLYIENNGSSTTAWRDPGAYAAGQVLVITYTDPSGTVRDTYEISSSSDNKSYSQNYDSFNSTLHYVEMSNPSAFALGDLAGFRYTNIGIPKGSVIKYAGLRVYPYSTSDHEGDPNWVGTVQCEAADNPAAWTGTTADFSGRLLTSGSTIKTIGRYPGFNDCLTGDFSAEIQAIIDRPGWSRYNPIHVYIEAPPSVSVFDRTPSYSSTGGAGDKLPGEISTELVVLYEPPTGADFSISITTEFDAVYTAGPSIDFPVTIEMEAASNATMEGAADLQIVNSVYLDSEIAANPQGEINFGIDLQFSVFAEVPGTPSNATQILHVQDADGGDFTITYQAETTGTLPYNATSSQIETALEGLAAIGSGNIQVTGGPGATSPILIVGQNDLAGTPMGVLSTDSSGLTSSVGLTPKAATLSVAPGYSADDDYGHHSEMQIVIAGINYGGVLQGVKMSRADNGGDMHASGSFFARPPYADSLVLGNETVVLVDKKGGHWTGLLEVIHMQEEYEFALFQFEARGRWTNARDLQFIRKQVFSPPYDTQEVFRQVRYNLLYQVSAREEFYTWFPGKTFNEPSEDFYSRYAGDVLQAYAEYGDSIGRSLTFGVRLAMEPGYSEVIPILYLEPESLLVPTYRVYQKDGARVTTEIDTTQYITDYYIEYGEGDTRGLAHVPAIDYPPYSMPYGLSYRPRSLIVPNQNFPSAAHAENYGWQLRDRHKSFVAGGSIYIPGGCPIYSVETGRIVPPWRVIPNRIFDVPDHPNGTDGIPEHILRATSLSWTQDDNSLDVTIGKLADPRLYVARQSGGGQGNRPEIETRSIAPNEEKNRTVVAKPDHPIPPALRITQVSTSGSIGEASGRPLEDRVVLEQIPLAARFHAVQYALSLTQDEGYLIVPYDCIVRKVFGLGPRGQAGTVEVVVGRSKFSEYPSNANLTRLTITGSPGKGESPTIAQQLYGGDVVYFSFPTPPDAEYDFVLIALIVEVANS